MKKILFIICLSAMITACRKGDIPIKGFAGTWEIMQQSGTIVGTTTNFPAGEGNLLVLNRDSTYKRFSKFQQISEGPYRIVKKGINWANNTYDAVYFDGNTQADFIVLGENELTIGNAFPDGVTTLYERRN